MFIYSTLDKPD